MDVRGTASEVFSASVCRAAPHAGRRAVAAAFDVAGNVINTQAIYDAISAQVQEQGGYILEILCGSNGLSALPGLAGRVTEDDNNRRDARGECVEEKDGDISSKR